MATGKAPHPSAPRAAGEKSKPMGLETFVVRATAASASDKPACVSTSAWVAQRRGWFLSSRSQKTALDSVVAARWGSNLQFGSARKATGTSQARAHRPTLAFRRSGKSSSFLRAPDARGGHDG